ncbi:zinc finger BED domain-containing protein RICESLEEPER 2-like [Rhizophagus irregularis DAOM 181602=DAOM 197198]|nr:zinc finger BED domain-containing protein RICESLEEPER 2-like [Rhizophagus irregularis DAOM 181602=DAOM 197198]
MHYINNNWELKNLLLDLIPVNGSYIAGLITSKLLQILEEFSISNNILALTTDNGSNMIACGNQLATELDQEFNNMAFTHYRCAAHIINLAVKAGMRISKPMYEATNLLSSSKNPTQASAICNKLKAYWDKYLNQSSITSSILDPRYKTTLFSHNDITEIISKLQELYLSYLPLNNQTIPSAPARSSRDYFLNLLNPNNIRQEVSLNSPCQ